MPARDVIHDAVRNALEKDGWTITADPYVITYEDLTLFADLAAKRIVAAHRGSQIIAVEAKSFLGHSATHDFHSALGQYEFYQWLIERADPGRELLLAVTAETYDDVFAGQAIGEFITDRKLPLIIVDPNQEEIVRWERPNDTANS